MVNKDKVLLISGSNPDMAPFVGFYEKIFKKNSIKFDILYWNRHGYMRNPYPDSIVYERSFRNDYSTLRKLYESFLFYLFCKKELKKRHYKSIICFTIMPFLFFGHFLKKNYNTKYIFDIRDYSPILKNGIFRRIVEYIIKNSAATVISSEGFKVWLPKSIDYTISHNTAAELLNTDYILPQRKQRLSILTIGYMIRFYPNDLIIDAFGGDEEMFLNFVGDGPVAEALKNYCLEKGYNNVSFSGRYNKEDEIGYYKAADMINILLPHGINSDSCMSNRFYNAVLTRKPMIVNEGCYQAQLVEKYHLGVVIYDYHKIRETVQSYWESFDVSLFNKGCVEFIEKVAEDIDLFEAKVITVCK